MTLTDTRPDQTLADPIRPILILLQHRDRMVRAAMLEQIIADGLQLTAPERRAIFERPDWHVQFPDLDVAIAAFYSPAALDYPFTVPESPRIWNIANEPQPVCRVPHRWFSVSNFLCGTAFGGLLVLVAAFVAAAVTR